MKAKKLMSLVLALCLVAALCGCAASPAPAADSASPAAETTDDPGVHAGQLRIGILQYAPHASLDNCYKGILEGLEAEGFVDGDNCIIEYVNGQGESETNSLAASNFVSEGCDVIIAIATPSATTCYAAAKDADIPVVFSACSDPVGAGLVASLEAPGSACTGTSDNINVKGQLKMIRAFLPEAKKIGILYTTSEANSSSQLASYKELAGDYGFEIVSVGVTDASEVATGAASLIAKGVDCITNLTDNNVVNNLSVVINAADDAGIPIFGSEVEQVAEYGCVAAEGLDYVALGVTTGKMAAAILNGADAAAMPVSVVTDSTPTYSETNMAKFGLTLPEDYKNAEMAG